MKKTLFLIGVLLSNVVLAAEKKEFIIGVQNFSSNPAWTWDGKEWRGYFRAFLDEFAKKKGYTFTYKAMPIKRLNEEYLNTETVDVRCPDNARWVGDMKAGMTIAYSKPIIKNYDGIWVKPENKGKGVDKLKKIGIVMGFTPFPYLSLIKAGKITSIENANYEGLLLQSIAGRNDGAYAGSVAGQYHLKEVIKNPNGLVFDNSLPFSESFYSCGSKKYHQLIKEMDDFMINEAKLISDLKKTYNVIENEYK